MFQNLKVRIALILGLAALCVGALVYNQTRQGDIVTLGLDGPCPPAGSPASSPPPLAACTHTLFLIIIAGCMHSNKHKHRLLAYTGSCSDIAAGSH